MKEKKTDKQYLRRIKKKKAKGNIEVWNYYLKDGKRIFEKNRGKEDYLKETQRRLLIYKKKI